MTETTSTPTRRRHILRGDNMVTVVRPITIDGERLLPGRHRFALDADLVRARPELFMPAWSGDREVQTRLRAQIRMRSKPAAKVRRRSWRLDTTSTVPPWRL